jgi:hypothetical protein
VGPPEIENHLRVVFLLRLDGNTKSLGWDRFVEKQTYRFYPL